MVTIIFLKILFVLWMITFLETIIWVGDNRRRQMSQNQSVDVTKYILALPRLQNAYAVKTDAYVCDNFCYIFNYL